MKIMVVDDSKTIRLILNKTLLQSIPLVSEIVLCESGQEAIDKLENLDIDLVLLDVIMDGLDGYETCKLIKSNPKTKELSVIFLTSKSKQEDILRGFEVGGVDYVSKPFNKAELIARVQTQLELVHLKNKEIEKTQSEVIFKMGEIAELRSKETGNHVKRVASYCALLGKLHGLDVDKCNDLELASPMHDIGKVAIADVFDALGSDRVYKKAWENDDIVKYFIEEKGKHFDPNLVSIFLENIDKFIEVQKKYDDKF